MPDKQKNGPGAPLLGLHILLPLLCLFHIHSTSHAPMAVQQDALCLDSVISVQNTCIQDFYSYSMLCDTGATVYIEAYSYL